MGFEDMEVDPTRFVTLRLNHLVILKAEESFSNGGNGNSLSIRLSSYENLASHVAIIDEMGFDSNAFNRTTASTLQKTLTLEIEMSASVSL